MLIERYASSMPMSCPLINVSPITWGKFAHQHPMMQGCGGSPMARRCTQQ